jgi:thiol:disulfide interchange protein
MGTAHEKRRRSRRGQLARGGRILSAVPWYAYALGIGTPLLGFGSVAPYGYWLKRNGYEKLRR